MPEGVVEWYDTRAGEGRIVRSGRRYTVRDADIESRARWPGARVHFDVARDRGDVAVGVTAQPGRRSGRHHRRAGDRSGRRWVDQAPGPSGGRRRPAPGQGVEHRPGELAERWAVLVGRGDLEDVIRLYAPHAVVRQDEQVAVGPDAIRRYWADSPLMGRAPVVTADHGDDTVMLRWPSRDDGSSPGTRMSIVHGEIEDQWIGDVATSVVRHGADETPVIVASDGRVGPSEWNHAIDQVGRVVERIGDPVLGVTVRLGRSTDPARERGATATATIDVDGWPVRARADAAELRDAVDLLVDRLRDRLRHLDEQRLALRHRGAEHEVGTWRHGDRATPGPSYFPRPLDERQVVRRKTFSTPESTIDEAIFDMETLGHDFFLFTDLATGEDAVVWRDGDGHRVRFASGTPAELALTTASEVVVDPAPTPASTVGAACERLDDGDEPWVFFRDAETDRGRVVYRRYDGHYGVITPADEPG
jgi:ribosome-associated translation inhibitor RaiA